MRNLFYPLLAFILMNCKQEEYPTSRFESYFDTSAINNNKFYKQRVDLFTSIYNLSTISKGTTDSLVIRFWPSESFEPFDHMFEFKLDSIGWKGYHYLAYSFPDQDGAIRHPYSYENFGDSVFIVNK